MDKQNSGKGEGAMSGITRDETGTVSPPERWEEGKVNVITVDIDEPYKEWTENNLKRTRELVYKGVAGVTAAFIRRSSGGNVHIKIHLDHYVTVFESFMIRAFLCDDAARLACDLDRYYRTGDLENTGRTFNTKYTRGEVRIAGKWLRF